MPFHLNKNTLVISSVLAFVMLLTRGSHLLTPFALPDASVVLFLLGGLLLGRFSWFAALFTLSAGIDYVAAVQDPAMGFCLTAGYWGMLPTYAVMWFGGLYLSRQARPFAVWSFSVVSMLTSSLAFVISTQSYYLFSGRFPDAGVWASLQQGWGYLPAWLAYTALYIGLTLLANAVWQRVQATQLGHTTA